MTKKKKLKDWTITASSTLTASGAEQLAQDALPTADTLHSEKGEKADLVEVGFQIVGDREPWSARFNYPDRQILIFSVREFKALDANKKVVYPGLGKIIEPKE